jgi:dTDP-glucose 4,6-dehydratase
MLIMAIDLNGKKILVTGGLGFIGSNFIEYVIKNYKNLQIVNYDKSGHGSRPLYHTSKDKLVNIDENFYTWICGDLSYEDYNAASIKNVLKNHKFDYIFHFAAESHVDRSINSPAFFIENNVVGMVNLLEGIRLHQPDTRMINISTDEVYGHLSMNDKPFTEDSPFDPRSPYAASKASADMIASSYVNTFNLNVVTTHCCNNFGPNQADEKFLPTIIRHIVKGEKIPVYGDGTNVREWIFVYDHNKSILEIAEYGKSGEHYNIGSGVEKSNLDLILEVLRILKFKKIVLGNYINFVEDRKGHDFRYAIDTKKYIRNFNLTKFEDSLTSTIEHYKVKYSK